MCHIVKQKWNHGFVISLGSLKKRWEIEARGSVLCHVTTTWAHIIIDDYTKILSVLTN